MDLMLMPLREIPDLPARVRNHLDSMINGPRRHRTRYRPPLVQDLLKYSAEDLLKTRNLGPSTVRKTERALRKLGLRLRSSPETQMQLQTLDHYVLRQGSLSAGGPFTQEQAEDVAKEAQDLAPGHRFLVLRVIKTYGET